MTNARLSFCHPIVPEEKFNLKKNLLLIIRGFLFLFPFSFHLPFLYSLQWNSSSQGISLQTNEFIQTKKSELYILYIFLVSVGFNLFLFFFFFFVYVFFFSRKLVGKSSWLFAYGGNCNCSSSLKITSLRVFTHFSSSSFSVECSDGPSFLYASA